VTTDATDFTVELTTARGESVVAVTGDVDLATIGDLRRSLRGVIDQALGDVVLDLSNVTYMDSSGLSVVLETRDVLQRNGRALIVANPSAQVATILKLCGLTDHLETRVGDASEPSPPAAGS
jgi:anti-sigma B factor antagonist